METADKLGDDQTRHMNNVSGLSGATIAKFSRNENATTDTLIYSYGALERGLSDICEVTKENS